MANLGSTLNQGSSLQRPPQRRSANLGAQEKRAQGGAKENRSAKSETALEQGSTSEQQDLERFEKMRQQEEKKAEKIRKEFTAPGAKKAQQAYDDSNRVVDGHTEKAQNVGKTKQSAKTEEAIEKMDRRQKEDMRKAGVGVEKKDVEETDPEKRYKANKSSGEGRHSRNQQGTNEQKRPHGQQQGGGELPPQSGNLGAALQQRNQEQDQEAPSSQNDETAPPSARPEGASAPSSDGASTDQQETDEQKRQREQQQQDGSGPSPQSQDEQQDAPSARESKERDDDERESSEESGRGGIGGVVAKAARNPVAAFVFGTLFFFGLLSGLILLPLLSSPIATCIVDTDVPVPEDVQKHCSSLAETVGKSLVDTAP